MLLLYKRDLAREKLPHAHPGCKSEGKFLKFPIFFGSPPHRGNANLTRDRIDCHGAGRGLRFPDRRKNLSGSFLLSPSHNPTLGLRSAWIPFSPGWLPPREKIHADGGETSPFLFPG